MANDGDAFFQKTFHTTDGAERQTVTRIDLVLGAGTADDVYLAWDEEDRLTELPVAWIWPTGSWGISHFCSPYGSGDFSRAMTVRCMECHNTWIDHAPGSVNHYRREGVILGVTCERCHGPGREHVAFHRANKQVSDAHAILNPGALDRERSIEVCTQCHSNAITSRRAPFSYRPGEPLADYYRTLSIERSEDDHVANQIENLRQSKCFQASSTMTCVTCHDPHRGGGRASRAEDSCLQCHDESHCGERDRVPDALRHDCVGCHMPPRIKINVKFEANGQRFVPPIRRFQHRIAIDPLARDTVLLTYYRQRADERSRNQADTLGEHLVSEWLSRAERYRQDRRFLAAIGAVREAMLIRDDPGIRATLHELEAVQSRLYDQWARALHQITENRLAEAQKTLDDMLHVKPDDAEVHSKLGTIHAIRGNKTLAVEHLNAAIEFDPDNASGFGVLGRMSFREGRFEEALRLWRRAAEVEPYHAQIQFDIGHALAGLNDLPKAIEHVERALEIDPTRMDVLVYLVNLHVRAGRLDDAIETADLAAEADPATYLSLKRELEVLKTSMSPGPSREN